MDVCKMINNSEMFKPTFSVACPFCQEECLRCTTS